MHIVFDALIDVIPVWLGFVPFEHADEPVSVFAALVLALCEGIARLIRVGVVHFKCSRKIPKNLLN